MQLDDLKSAVAASRRALEDVEEEEEFLRGSRTTMMTRVGDIQRRYPEMAEELEQGYVNHVWEPEAISAAGGDAELQELKDEVDRHRAARGE